MNTLKWKPLDTSIGPKGPPISRGAILKLKSLGVKNYFYEIIYMENNI